MGAVISNCGLYRYRLDREIGWPGRPVAFCLHNPSTADAALDDPTSRRGIGFARLWQASTLAFVNPWAGRATKPADLWAMDDPVGPENDWHIETVARHMATNDGFMVAAWGAVSPPKRFRAAAWARLKTVEQIIRDCGCPIMALGVTASGEPRHPLYLRSDSQPAPWPSPSPATDDLGRG